MKKMVMVEDSLKKSQREVNRLQEATRAQEESHAVERREATRVHDKETSLLNSRMQEALRNAEVCGGISVRVP